MTQHLTSAPQPTKIVLPMLKTSTGSHPDGTEFVYTYASNTMFVYGKDRFITRLEVDDWDILEHCRVARAKVEALQ